MIDLNNAGPQQDSNSPPHYTGGYTGGDVDAEDIRRRLNEDVRGFVSTLYSRAFLSRTEARIGNIFGQPGESLCIELGGKNVGCWYDHATDEGGDLISLYRGYMGYTGNTFFAQSLRELARDYLGDSIELSRWGTHGPNVKERIAADRAKWGDKPKRESEVLGAPIATYRYLDVDGNIIAAVTRYEPKTFRPWCFREVDGEKKWMVGSPTIRPLYHLPEIARSDDVILVEGEGKADALAQYGVVTTSVMGGANAVDKTNWLPLGRKRVCIWPDNDPAGKEFMTAAIAKLRSIGCRIWIVQIPPGKPPKWDCADCIKEGGDPKAVLATAIELADDKAKPTGPPIFDYLDIKQIKAKADPVWLIDGMINEQSLGFVYGPPGSLKTFICLSLALSLTTQQPDWWERTILRHGAVVYLCREGTASLKFRIMAWEKHYGFLLDHAPFYLVERSINFLKPDDVNTLLATVQAIANAIALPIAAVFVDTVSRVLTGAKENSQEDMSIFVEACGAVQKAFECVVIGVHHTNKEGGFRGSSVMPGGGDFLIEVRREPGAMSGSLFAEKIKDAEDGWEQGFKVEKIELDNAKSSLVVLPMQIAKGFGGNLGWPDRETCKQILKAIDDQWIAGNPWCYAKNSSRAAVPNIMKRWRLKRELVDDILKTWTANGVIVEGIRDTTDHIRGYRKLVDI